MFICSVIYAYFKNIIKSSVIILIIKAWDNLIFSWTKEYDVYDVILWEYIDILYHLKSDQFTVQI